MKLRNPIIGAVASLALAGSFGVSAAHAAPTVPSTGGTSLHMVSPSTLASNGDFEIEILATHPVGMCDFYLYRYTSEFGYQYLGYYGGTNTDDLASPSWGYTYYNMYPVDCSSNEGSYTQSPAFYVNNWDNPFSGYSGSYGTVYNSKFYGGSALELFSHGAGAEWNTDCDYNFSVTVGTGPSGGIGTVYLGGGKIGTINFWSKKAGYKKIAFKYGYPSCEYSFVDVVMTGHGKGGGYDAWLDAGQELYN